MNKINLGWLLSRRPQAMAEIKGGNGYPSINGIVYFYQTRFGTVVAASLSGLPLSMNQCQSPVFAFHIHSGENCRGNKEDSFADVLSHYNPNDCAHPYHAGDLPPLFGCNGIALTTFLTDRFSVKEIIGKTIVVHRSADDFVTQPSGNSGMKIACGEIKQVH